MMERYRFQKPVIEPPWPQPSRTETLGICWNSSAKSWLPPQNLEKWFLLRPLHPSSRHPDKWWTFPVWNVAPGSSAPSSPAHAHLDWQPSPRPRRGRCTIHPLYPPSSWATRPVPWASLPECHLFLWSSSSLLSRWPPPPWLRASQDPEVWVETNPTHPQTPWNLLLLWPVDLQDCPTQPMLLPPSQPSPHNFLTTPPWAFFSPEQPQIQTLLESSEKRWWKLFREAISHQKLT